MIASTDKQTVVCQPMVTKGGLVPATLAYPRITTLRSPPSATDFDYLTANIAAIPFFPHDMREHGVLVQVMTEGRPRCPNENRPTGKSIAFNEETFTLLVIDNLHWDHKRTAVDAKKRLTHFTAWFEGSWFYETHFRWTWASSPNVTYEHNGSRFSINLDSLYMLPREKTVIGSVTTCMCNHIADCVVCPKLPKSVSFYIVVNREGAIEGPIFDRNPKLFFIADGLNVHSSMLNEPNFKEIVVMAPYDIIFTGDRHVVRLNISYTWAGRSFLISGVSENDTFYTGLNIWKPDTQLKITLCSHVDQLTLPQGTPIATLYSIDSTNGTLNDYNDRNHIRYYDIFDLGDCYIGDVQLPNGNFAPWQRNSN